MYECEVHSGERGEGRVRVEGGGRREGEAEEVVGENGGQKRWKGRRGRWKGGRGERELGEGKGNTGGKGEGKKVRKERGESRDVWDKGGGRQRKQRKAGDEGRRGEGKMGGKQGRLRERES